MNIRASWLLAGVLFFTTGLATEQIAAQTSGSIATAETATTLITLGTRGGPLQPRTARSLQIFWSSTARFI